MTDPLQVLPQHQVHPRSFRNTRYAYPVLSRRSKGISIGINLNPDKICNFDCIYCQVDRRSDAELKFVDADRLVAELEAAIDQVVSGSLFENREFADVPIELRRLNDLAFSGDGEPTTFVNFDEIVHTVAQLKRSRGLDTVKLVLITNASMFHRPRVAAALDILTAAGGEIWAKLDAGTPEYYQLIERTPIPFEQILTNLQTAAQRHPLVIQSLFMRVDGQGPGTREIDAFADRLREIQARGGRLDRVQVYTVARQPAESFVSALPDAEVDAIASRLRERVALCIETYYGC